MARGSLSEPFLVSQLLSKTKYNYLNGRGHHFSPLFVYAISFDKRIKKPVYSFVKKSYTIRLKLLLR